MTQEQYQWLKDNGYDPAVYDVDEQGNVFENPIEQARPKKVMSAPRAFGTSFLGSVLPSAAGLYSGAQAGALGGSLAGPVGSVLGAIGGGLVGGYGAGKLQEAALEKFAPQAIEELSRAQTEQPVASYLGGFAPNALTFRPSLQGMSGLLRPTVRGEETLRAALSNPNFVAPAANIAANVGASGAGQLLDISQGGEFSGPRFAADVALGTLFNRPTALGRAIGFQDIPQPTRTAAPELAPARDRAEFMAYPPSEFVTPREERLGIGRDLEGREQFFTPEGERVSEKAMAKDYTNWWKSETEPTTELLKGAAEEVKAKIPKERLKELSNDPEVGEVLRDPSKLPAFIAKQADQTLEDVFQMMERRRSREFATAEEAANQKAFRELQAERGVPKETALGNVEEAYAARRRTPETEAQKLYGPELAGPAAPKPPAPSKAASGYDLMQPQVKQNATEAAREVYTRLQRPEGAGENRITQQDIDFAAEVAARRGLKIELDRAFSGDQEVRGMYFVDKDGNRIIRVNPLMATPDTAIHEIGHDIFKGVTNKGMRRSLLDTALDSPAYKSELAAREAEVKAGRLTPEAARDIALEEGLIQAFGEQMPGINRGELRAWFKAFKASMKQLATGKLSPEDALAWMHYASTEAVPWKGVAVGKTGEERMQRAQQETPEFKNWFGESRVVDAEGKAKPIYHGTTADITEFKKPLLDPHALYGPGIYMTESKDVAGGEQGYVFKGLKDYEHADAAYEVDTDLPLDQQIESAKKQALEEGYTPEDLEHYIYVPSDEGLIIMHNERYASSKRSPNVIPLYAKIEKPFDINAIYDDWETIAQQMDSVATKLFGDKYLGIDFDRLAGDSGNNIIGRSLYKALSRSFDGFLGKQNANKVLQAMGYDGITHTGGLSQRYGSGKPHKVWIAFEPEQVKSAIGNKGTFSPKSRDIRYQRGEQPLQEISSAETSLAQIPAIFKSKTFVPRGTNIDIGAGKFDLGKQYLETERGVSESVPFDPFNRSIESNRMAVERLQSGERFGTATIPNVLNVIAEASARDNVILQAARAIEPEGVAYFQIYEGDRSGVGRKTSKGFQNNKKTSDYANEVSKHFDNVRSTGNIIVASGPKLSDRKAFWQLSSDVGGPSVRYQRSLLSEAKTPAELDYLASKGGPFAEVARSVRNAYNTRDYKQGQWSSKYSLTTKLPEEARVRLLNHLAGEFDSGVLKAPAPDIRAAYDQLRNEYLPAIVNDYNAKGLMVRDTAGLRARGSNPTYFPLHAIADEVKTILTTKQGSPEWDKLKADFLNWNTQLRQADGASLAEAQRYADEKFAEMQNIVAKPPGIESGISFAGARKPEGYPLPPSWRSDDIVEMLNNYTRRSATDYAYQTHVESSPVAMAALGAKTMLNNQPIPANVLQSTAPIITEPSVQSVLREYRGTPAQKTEGLLQSAGRLTSAATIGTVSKVGDIGTSMFKGLAYLPPSEYASGLAQFVNKIADFAALKERSYASGLNKRDAAENMRQVLGIAEDSTAFMDKAARLLSKVTFVNELESVARTIAQGWGETVVGINKKLALGGDKNATQMLDTLSPDWRTRPDADLAAQVGRLLQGSYDMRQLPASVLEGAAAPYLTWSKWSIGQYDAFVKYAIQPAMQGNMKPLIGQMLIGLLGGGAVSAVQEWLNNREGKDITWGELESWMQQNQGELGADGGQLLAQKLLTMAQKMGTFGFAGDLVKMTMDALAGGSSQGIATMPAVDAIYDVSKRTAAAIQALDDGEDFGLVMKALMKDSLVGHVQALRVARNWLDEDENLRYDDRRRQRLYDALSGLPSKGGAFSVSYSNLSEREFERGEIGEDTGEEAMSLVSKAREQATTPEDYASRIRKLKTSQNQIMPSLERQPMKAARYLSWLEGTEEGRGGETMRRYMVRKGEDEYRKSLIEGLSGLR